MQEIAKAQGQSFFEEILNTRAWNALHGGVYVPISENTQPNPFLEVANREITIDSLHIKLTKVNPAYMTRQISEIAQDKSSIKYHITSLNPIRPANKADVWEKEQLLRFESGETESFQYITNKSVFRYMAPLKVTASCMKCHAKQGYQLGDVRGGISVTLLARKHLLSAKVQKRNIAIIHVVVFILGALGIIYFLYYSEKQLIKERKIRQLISQKNKLLHSNEEKLLATSEHLEVMNRTKDKLMSIIAHDLKNPFSSIMGLSRLLLERDNTTNEGQIEKYAMLINSTSQRAYTLLVNLLEWSRLQTGELKFDPKIISVDILINEIEELLSVGLEQKAIVLKKKLDKEVKVFADRNMIHTILRNLVTNAIKYTNMGGHIQILIAQSVEYTDISVIDNGVGIAEENLEKLFKVDSGYSTRGTNDETGTGLGLALCNEFAAKHKGIILIDTALGEGSTFTLRLPRKFA